MGIREEFKKSLMDYSASKLPYAGNQEIQDGWVNTATQLNTPVALWAAGWMAEKCANYIESQSLPDAYSEPCLEDFGKEIRQLARELKEREGKA